jgi:hypothetical protein
MTAGAPTTALAGFQDAFARALLAPDEEAHPGVAALAAKPAFAVYRNTVMKGCIDALAANYPAVLRLVGEEWFRAAAAVHVRAAPPDDPVLARYGGSFAAFLADFEPARELPYLPGVARLDRYWTEAHVAADAAALNPADLSALAPAALEHTVARPHPAARWAWFEEGPVHSIWSANRNAGTDAADYEWEAEGALVTRPRDAVEWRPLDRAGCAFLDACAAGGTLAEAAAAALAAQGNADLARLMATLLEAGALCRLEARNENRLEEPA